MILKLEKIFERDIDLLMINNFSKGLLIDLFLSKIGKKDYFIDSIEHSFQNQFGENDITVILESKDELEEVEFLASVGKNLNLVPLFDDELHLAENVRIIKEKPVRIEGDKKANLLVTDKGSYSFDGLFILRKSVPASHLLMGLEMDDVHIKVNRLMETNLRGVFAAGDIVGKPYQYIKSAGEGNIAALSAVTYLANLKKEGKNNE